MMEIDAIRLQFNADQKILLNACLAFVMFGVALHVSLDDFRRVTRFPKSILVGLASQWLVMPILTVYLIHLWNPPPSVALGLILVASCPGGNMSNFITQYSRGNTALSLTLTSIVSISSIILTPLAFLCFAYFVPQTKPLFEVIALDKQEMLKILMILLVMPMSLGIFCGRFFPRFTDRIRKPVQWISLFIFISFIVGSLVHDFHALISYVHLVFLLVVVHNLMGMAAGYYWAKWHALPDEDAKAISMETGIQNAGLGLTLVLNFFPALGGMILVTATWAIWDMISSLLLGIYWNKRDRKKSTP